MPRPENGDVSLIRDTSARTHGRQFVGRVRARREPASAGRQTPLPAAHREGHGASRSLAAGAWRRPSMRFGRDLTVERRASTTHRVLFRSEPSGAAAHASVSRRRRRRGLCVPADAARSLPRHVGGRPCRPASKARRHAVRLPASEAQSAACGSGFAAGEHPMGSRRRSQSVSLRGASNRHTDSSDMPF